MTEEGRSSDLRDGAVRNIDPTRGDPTSAAGAFSFACVVLAAGAGRRFGVPKAVAALPDGTRFVDAVASTAMEAGAVPVVVVLRPGFTPPYGVRTVFNPEAESEQIASVRLGLAQLANAPVAGALLWPVDCPLVGSDTARAVVTSARQKSAPIAVPTFEGKRGHPTYFARPVWPELMTVREGGARAILHSYGEAVVEVPVEDAGVLADVDTTADLEQLQGGSTAE